MADSGFSSALSTFYLRFFALLFSWRSINYLRNSSDGRGIITYENVCKDCALSNLCDKSTNLSMGFVCVCVYILILTIAV